ncbi:MAG: mechanosensitive ion channel [Atopobiaceae bacterium]|nr:mechanosensitive ion channel [Atopobiaceae bacterium]
MNQAVKDFVGTSEGHAIVVAVVTLFLTTMAAHFAVRLVRKLLTRDDVPLSSSSLIENIVRIAIWSIGGSFVLSECFGINVAGLVAALGVGGVALSLGLQDTMSNFIGGLQVTLMNIVQPGDHIKIGSTEGMVLDVTWRQTIVKDFENTVHTIPNSSINSGEVEQIEPKNLVSTMIAFTNDTRDLDETIHTMEVLAKEAVEGVAELERDPWILLTQIGEYGTWAKLRFVLKEMTNVREARDAALRAISPYTHMNPEDLPQRQ